MDSQEYKIKIDITFSRILDWEDINGESIDFETRKMVNELNEKYVGLDVKYESMDVDHELHNLIFIKISAVFYSATPYQAQLNNIGAVNCKNLKLSFEENIFLDDYFLEKMNFEVFEIVTTHRVNFGNEQLMG